MGGVRSAAVERADAPAEVSQATLVRQVIDRQSSAFATVLPAHVDPDRFSRLVLAAVKAAPELMRCFETTDGQTSVLIAAMQAASVGLEPNTPTREAWILPRRNGQVWEARLEVGYCGYRNLAEREGGVSIYGEVVHERDVFSYSRGLACDQLEHVPCDEDDPGELTHAYAVARYADGRPPKFLVMPRREIEKRRAQSDSWKSEKGRPYSPWTKWTEEQWKKTAVRTLCKQQLRLSADVFSAMDSDGARLSLSDDGTVEAAYTVDEQPALATGAPETAGGDA